jgi:hypothetical protein
LKAYMAKVSSAGEAGVYKEAFVNTLILKEALRRCADGSAESHLMRVAMFRTLRNAGKKNRCSPAC